MFGPGVSTIPSATNAKAKRLVSDGIDGSPKPNVSLNGPQSPRRQLRPPPAKWGRAAQSLMPALPRRPSPTASQPLCDSGCNRGADVLIFARIGASSPLVARNVTIAAAWKRQSLACRRIRHTRSTRSTLLLGLDVFSIFCETSGQIGSARVYCSTKRHGVKTEFDALVGQLGDRN